MPVYCRTCIGLLHSGALAAGSRPSLVVQPLVMGPQAHRGSPQYGSLLEGSCCMQLLLRSPLQRPVPVLVLQKGHHCLATVCCLIKALHGMLCCYQAGRGVYQGCPALGLLPCASEQVAGSLESLAVMGGEIHAGYGVGQLCTERGSVQGRSQSWLRTCSTGISYSRTPAPYRLRTCQDACRGSSLASPALALLHAQWRTAAVVHLALYKRRLSLALTCSAACMASCSCPSAK